MSDDRELAFSAQYELLDEKARNEIADRIEAAMMRRPVRANYGKPMTYPFVDPIRGMRCLLVVDQAKPAFHGLGVRHPGCDVLADVSADLDAFYCAACGWNGRVDGAWALGLWRDAQP